MWCTDTFLIIVSLHHRLCVFVVETPFAELCFRHNGEGL